MPPDLELPSPVHGALDQFEVALDHLVKTVEDGGLDHFDTAGLVRFLQRFERFRNRLPLVDHVAIKDAARRNLPAELCQPSMVAVLVQALRLSAGEAAARVRAAEAVGPRSSMLGEALAPARPVLAAAQRAGEVSPEQVQIVERALAGVAGRGFDPADIDAGERLLTRFAAEFGPRDLRRLATQVVDGIDPDGTRPADEVNSDRRFLAIRATGDGAYRGEFRLTGALGAKLTSLLGPLASPRDTALLGCDKTPEGTPANAHDPGPGPGRAGHGTVVADERTVGQRMHDALEEVCDRVLRAGEVPDAGGTATSLIITINAEDLAEGRGYGVAADGTLVPAFRVRELADEAEVYPAVMSESGAMLALGRARRIASKRQTMALVARDGGCSFPGCGHPPQWCERHHLVGWAEGGRTDVDNLTLLCRYHHHNFASRGWRCQLTDDGLPGWVPPKWLSRSRQPVVNCRILTSQTIARQRGARRDRSRVPAP